MENSRDGFGSKLGIIAAAAGSAIGLGNIWKFPYITGEYGGAAFIIIYLICIMLIGLPVMLSAFIIGRRGQKNVVGSYRRLAPKTSWYFTGVLGVIASMMILGFYGVVAGWTLDYVVSAGSGSLLGQSPEAFEGNFVSLISSTWTPILYQLGFMIVTGVIVIAGVKKGIEKYSKILMPLLLLMLIVLVIRGLTLPNAMGGVEFLFKPDFSKLSVEAVIAALGHAFFSLSVGTGTMLTYGSYISKKENLTSTAIQVTLADTGIALLAGLAIFPAVFAFNIEPDSGVGLVFMILPNVFQQIPGGAIFAILFFGLLAVAALTSSISILEVVVAYFSEELKISRKMATVLSTVIISIIGVFASLSQGSLSNITIGGLNIFDTLDFIASYNIMPLGGLLMCLFVGYKLKKSDVLDELTNGGKLRAGLLPIFFFLVRIIAPILIAIVYLNSIIDTFFKS